MLQELKRQASHHLQMNNWAELAECCMQLMQVEPNDHRHCLNLARCFANLGNQPKQLATLTVGERNYRDELEVFAGHKIALFSKSKLYRELIDYLIDLDRLEPDLDIQRLILTIPKSVSNEHLLEFILPHLLTDPSAVDLTEGCARLLLSRKLYLDARELLDKVPKPTAKTWIYRGSACANLGQIREAEISYENASGIINTADEEVLYLRMKSDFFLRTLRHSEAYELLEQASKIDPMDRAVHQAAYTQLLYLDDYTKIKNIETHAELWRKSLPVTATKFPKDRAPNHPLKVGFISHGFKVHPVGWMIAGLLVELSKIKNIKVHIFDLSPDKDYIAQTIQTVSTEYTDVASLNSDKLYHEIKTQDLDILIDCDGYQPANRLEVICRRPAPVIIKWVGGLAASTHLDVFDYLITDTHQTPAELRNMFSESLIFIPQCYVTYTPPPYSLQIASAPHISNGYITFGCMNNAVKITETCISLWAQILEQSTTAKLLLKDKLFDSPELVEDISQRFEMLGIDRRRLIFLGGTHHTEHLKAHESVDIALDPVPYSGGLCTLEALYMGVPVVAMAGQLLCHRHSVTHLAQVNESKLVATSEHEYIQIASNLASNPQRICEYRQTLRKKLMVSSLCDHAKFANDFVDELKKAAV